MSSDSNTNCSSINTSALPPIAFVNSKQYFQGILALEQFHVQPSFKEGNVGSIMGSQTIVGCMGSM